jgi:hypothetical protein
MTMSSENREALRASSRTLGLFFQLLSVLTILATVYSTLKVVAVGSQWGIGAVHDPISWLIFLGGSFAALMLTGIGHVLGMLCAIFDRQQMVQQHVDVRPPLSTSSAREWRPQSGARPTVWEIAAEEGVKDVTVKPERVPTVSKLSGDEFRSSSTGLWGWLTRERHFSSRKNDKRSGGG